LNLIIYLLLFSSVAKLFSYAGKMQIEIYNQIGKKVVLPLRSFFTSIQSKLRNFIKEKVFGNIVREMIVQVITISQNQQKKKPLSRKDFKDLLPKPKYGSKINIIKSYFEHQDYLFGQLSEESFMDQLKTMTIKEVDDLYESIDEMNKSVNERKDFSFIKIENISNLDALNFQKELDERGSIHVEKEVDDDEK
jgi:hypothetical protein